MVFRICFLFLVSIANANAVTLTQNVPSDILFDLNLNTPTEAGTYFSDSQSSSSNATLLSIGGIPNTTKWTIYAKLTTDITSPRIKIRIKRTGNGTGSTVPTGNTGNLILKAADWRKLFSGKGNRFDIPMQTQAFSIGVNDGHGTFETDVEFKVETK